MDPSKIATTEGAGDGGGGNRAIVPTTTITTVAGNSSGGGDTVVGSNSRFGRQWQHSSRIIRVSRASGGKDRHSKVWTAKGPRDRRVRLSVTTAIQFYDLQDRLGYDQPSKAVEWLIKAAAEAINELPSLDTASFPPETPRQLSDETRVSTNVVDELDGLNQQQMGSKSGCSSNNSDTSKGSGGLSLSQKEIRNKARERARERTAKEKEPSRVNNTNHNNNDVGSSHLLNQHQQNVRSGPQTSSFTQLLTAGLSSNLNESNNGGASSSPSLHHGTSMADYFGTGYMGLSSTRTGQIQEVMTLTSFGGSENHHNHHHNHHVHDQLQQFPFVSDHHHHNHHNHHLIQVANTASGGSGSGNDYNLNFTMSSSSTGTPSLTAGFNNRGTLQSNSPSLLPYIQRFSADGTGFPFFLSSAAAVSTAAPTGENHHHQQFQPPGLQLCYGDGARQADQKGKGKN